jgi:hypothetical protein
MVEIRPADSSRIAHIAEVIGRAFVTEPMFAITRCLLRH